MGSLLSRWLQLVCTSRKPLRPPSSGEAGFKASELGGMGAVQGFSHLHFNCTELLSLIIRTHNTVLTIVYYLGLFLVRTGVGKHLEDS